MTNATKILPRGLRNCNPCNIRISKTKYLGEITPSQDRAFKQFKSMDWGYRAVFVLLHHYYHKRGLKTIRQIISRYAPPVENNTESYIKAVASAVFLSPDDIVPMEERETMILIVSAMSKVENGTPAVITDVIAGWELFRKHKP